MGNFYTDTIGISDAQRSKIFEGSIPSIHGMLLSYCSLGYHEFGLIEAEAVPAGKKGYTYRLLFASHCQRCGAPRLECV